MAETDPGSRKRVRRRMTAGLRFGHAYSTTAVDLTNWLRPVYTAINDTAGAEKRVE
jgi:hypothetical protein